MGDDAKQNEVTKDETKTETAPVLPLRDIVVFPHMIVPLFVGREKSVRALEDVMQDDKHILLLTQKNAAQDDPAREDLFTLGTVGTVLQFLKLPEAKVKVWLEGANAAGVARFPEKPEFSRVFPERVDEFSVIRASFRRWR